MKYTLVLGIEYKKYKNPGDIAVYVGGRLIDAFQIEQDVTFVREDAIISMLDETWYHRLDMTHLLKEHLQNGNHWKYTKLPKLFKIYEIEEQDLNGLVEIKVDNSHNDYNNGFMKNNSMIRFPLIGLFPSHFVENRGEQLMRIVKKIGDGEFKHKIRAGRKHSPTQADFFHDIHTWPCVKKYHIRQQSKKFKKNGSWWIGGSFTAEIPIKTKHRIKYLNSVDDKNIGFFNVYVPVGLFIATCKQLLNIYNEDQRSNRTED